MNAAFAFLAMAEACIDLAEGEEDAVRFELLDLADAMLDLADEEAVFHRQRRQ